MNFFITHTPLELAKGTLKACQAVDDLENNGASEQEGENCKPVESTDFTVLPSAVQYYCSK